MFGMFAVIGLPICLIMNNGCSCSSQQLLYCVTTSFERLWLQHNMNDQRAQLPSKANGYTKTWIIHNVFVATC